mmetsp:Transcript_15263/g.20914  ORF Transcript_15263/g.20914 Transcript_15263/m.20914 type:complete len:691 (+) Transcript_15263:1-2073(+)
MKFNVLVIATVFLIESRIGSIYAVKIFTSHREQSTSLHLGLIRPRFEANSYSICRSERSLHVINGRKIEDEESSLDNKNTSAKSKKKSKVTKKSNDAIPKALSSAPVSPVPEPSLADEVPESHAAPQEAAVAPVSADEEFGSNESIMSPLFEEGVFPNTGPRRDFSEDDRLTVSRDTQRALTMEAAGELRVPKMDPLKQSVVPPEVVFFGEPRNPPPAEAASDPRFHGSLLYWARHATAAPRSSQERLTGVFPRGPLHPLAAQYRLPEEGLTYERILSGFTALSDDLEAMKAYLDVNIDLVPSKLFLRALTADKLAAQSRNDLELMDQLKETRRRYILAHDQLFFPLNLEIQKAETRVMTYLARDEIREFAKDWDSVEMSLHFTTLLAARYAWDGRVKAILSEIKKKVDSTVEYMAEGLRADLMSREFRQPATTAEVYLNASLTLQRSMPQLYSRVRPEVQLVHETFFMSEPQQIQDFFTGEFCPRVGLSPSEVKLRLKMYIASLAAIQGVEYVSFRMEVQSLFRKLCSDDEWLRADRWFADFSAGGRYDFETYEPDSIPVIIDAEQRLRDPGDAFSKFDVEVLDGRTRYTPALSGQRKKGAELGNWLERDPDFGTEVARSPEERLEQFRKAFVEQSELRKQAESRLDRMIGNRLDQQERILYGGRFKSPVDDDAESRTPSQIIDFEESE